MPTPYPKRNRYSTPVCWRFPVDLLAQIEAAAEVTQTSKSQVVQHAVGVYLESLNQTPSIKESIMAVAKKKVAVKAKAAKPAAKTAAAKKK